MFPDEYEKYDEDDDLKTSESPKLVSAGLEDTQDEHVDPNSPAPSKLEATDPNAPESSKSESTDPANAPTGYLSIGRMIASAFPDEDSMFPGEYEKYDNTEAKSPEPQNLKPAELSKVPKGHKSIDQVSDDIFPDQKSTSPEKNQAPEQEHPKTESQGLDNDDFNVDNWPSPNVPDDLAVVDSLHPWGLIDYYRLNQYVEENPLEPTSDEPGVLVFTGYNCVRWFKYERLYTTSPQFHGKNPRFLFANIPIPNKNNRFEGERLVMFHDARTEEIIARRFDRLPSSNYNIWAVWRKGVDIYAFKSDDLWETIRNSVDDNDGDLIFPSISGRPYCREKGRKDHPGLQLVILIQAATFMAHISRVLSWKSQNPEWSERRTCMIDVVRQWRKVFERSSRKMWDDYISGLSKTEFIRKMMKDHSAIEALGLTHGKPYAKPWFPSIPSDLEDDASDPNEDDNEREKRRKEAACRRVQRQMDELFAPVEVERSSETRTATRKIARNIDEEGIFASHSTSFVSSNANRCEEDDNIFPFSPVTSSPIRREVHELSSHDPLKIPRTRPRNIPYPRRLFFNHQENPVEAGSDTAVDEDPEEETDVESETISGVSNHGHNNNGQDPDGASGFSRPHGAGNRHSGDKGKGHKGDSEKEIESEKGQGGYGRGGKGANESEADDKLEEILRRYQLPKTPMTSLVSLIDSLHDFVHKHPEIDNGENRVHVRTMLADMGITMRETRGQPPSVVQYLVNGVFHTPDVPLRGPPMYVPRD